MNFLNIFLLLVKIRAACAVQVLLISFARGQSAQSVNAHDLYPGSDQFELRPGHRIF